MRNKHQNKEQQYTHLQLPNRLFQVLFFPSNVNDWFNLDLNIRNPESVSIFKIGYFLLFAQFKLTYTIFLTQKVWHFELAWDEVSVILMTQFSRLSESCSCSLEIEDTSHYVLHWHNFLHHCVVLMNSVKPACDNFDWQAWQCPRRFTFMLWLAIWWK